MNIDDITNLWDLVDDNYLDEIVTANEDNFYDSLAATIDTQNDVMTESYMDTLDELFDNSLDEALEDSFDEMTSSFIDQLDEELEDQLVYAVADFV